MKYKHDIKHQEITLETKRKMVQIQNMKPTESGQREVKRKSDKI
jgi:hypothetical protein